MTPEQEEFDRRFQAARASAFGRWTPLLRALGVDGKVLNRRNQPCPIAACGGTDRFQYTDKFGDGNYVCRACGVGGGFKLLMGYFGWNAGTALRRVEQSLGLLPASPQAPGPLKDARRLVHRILSESRTITSGDEVDRYLRFRGVGMDGYPDMLRLHPALGYYELDPSGGKPKLVRNYPALVAVVQDQGGQVVSLLRTYLQDGRKALGAESKKLLCGGVNGAAIRLGEPAGELSVCEGVETGLAIRKRTGQPVWVGISASNLERIWIPDQVTRLRIYGDNDADAMFDGQAAAYGLARRYMKCCRHGEGHQAEVFIPRSAGADWANVSERHAAHEDLAA
ncbi:DUF7146 domain-containing protein [Pseudoduganella namucuonensis]|uniref:Putative DNA primase/helicase n=1 Tax=Pseudoduganella namucuonensis TaxID=1035707 RepID=A0A1I7HL01_9BURK|nr:toprim domain-containing protein [Pseudoduganella namucuonensis]SFU61322.1 putative DNA primase/helicase [Pseudoduganella namucuonensis]